MASFNIEEFDLSHLPAAEDDQFEFKSSRVYNAKDRQPLIDKLACAVSGFANSGGGCLVVGVQDSGDADGGLPDKIGRQDLCDWADKVIHENVNPTPRYVRHAITDCSGRGVITPGHAVLVVYVHESHSGPHMVARENKCYIRAGAHTVAAKHFIVEAIWAKRQLAKPRLACAVRCKPGQEDILQFGVVALTNAPAIDVQLNILPLLGPLNDNSQFFPLQIAVIDSHNPFYLDVTTFTDLGPTPPPLDISLTYTDLESQSYSHRTKI